jgi:hypothetical protein
MLVGHFSGPHFFFSEGLDLTPAVLSALSASLQLFRGQIQPLQCPTFTYRIAIISDNEPTHSCD